VGVERERQASGLGVARRHEKTCRRSIFVICLGDEEEEEPICSRENIVSDRRYQWRGGVWMNEGKSGRSGK
jgi:hypothetical protein